jgi:Helix-turn-helix domain
LEKVSSQQADGLPLSFLVFPTPRAAAGQLDKTASSDILNCMVKYITHALDETFSALADPTRRAILARLAKGHASVTELAKPFDVSLPAVMKHLGSVVQAWWQGPCRMPPSGSPGIGVSGQHSLMRFPSI